MYKTLVLTTAYFSGVPIHTISTNEPNKKQITKLVKGFVEHKNITGSLSEGEYLNQNEYGNKAYRFSIGYETIFVTVDRLPIGVFNKENDLFDFTSIEIQ